MGPLTLADFIGLDTCLNIMKVLHNDLADTKYRPCPLLVNYVNAGYLGKKSGRGFYTYKKWSHCVFYNDVADAAYHFDILVRVFESDWVVVPEQERLAYLLMSFICFISLVQNHRSQWS